MQWDTFFHHVLHVDLLRVKAGEKVTVEVPIELRGEVAGRERRRHHRADDPLDRDRSAARPDAGQAAHQHQAVANRRRAVRSRTSCDLPAGATVLADPDEMVVHCMLPVVEEEESRRPRKAGAAEPEVIAKGKEEGRGEEGEEKE